MATAGSGDVLRSYHSITSTNYKAKTASILGVYLHGKVGDFALNKKGYKSLIVVTLLITSEKHLWTCIHQIIFLTKNTI